MDLSDGTRGTDAGESPAAPHDWPCVGDPGTWDDAGWFTCGALGAVSLLALVPGERVAAHADGGPVLLHLTVCRKHQRRVNWWLRSRMHPQDDVVAASTAFVLENWGQVVGGLDVPLLAPVVA